MDNSKQLQYTISVTDNQGYIRSLTIGIRFQRSQWSLCKTSSENSRCIWLMFRHRPKETKTLRSRAGIARIDACGEGSSLVSPISLSLKQEAHEFTRG
jgi:hypothetical protein